MKYPREEKLEETKKEPLKEQISFFWNEEGGREMAIGALYFLLLIAPLFAPIIALALF